MPRLNNLLNKERILTVKEVSARLGWTPATVRRTCPKNRRYNDICVAEDVIDSDVVRYLLSRKDVLTTQQIVEETGWALKRTLRASSPFREPYAIYALAEGDWSKIKYIWDQGEVINAEALFESWGMSPGKAKEVIERYSDRLEPVSLRDGTEYWHVKG